MAVPDGLNSISTGIAATVAVVSAVLSFLSYRRTRGEITRMYREKFFEKQVDVYDEISHTLGEVHDALIYMPGTQLGGENAGLDAKAAILKHMAQLQSAARNLNRVTQDNLLFLADDMHQALESYHQAYTDVFLLFVEHEDPSLEDLQERLVNCGAMYNGVLKAARRDMGLDEIRKEARQLLRQR